MYQNQFACFLSGFIWFIQAEFDKYDYGKSIFTANEADLKARREQLKFYVDSTKTKLSGKTFEDCLKDIHE